MATTVRKVLVVEDDPDIQVILKMVLIRLGKCEVVATDQGSKVLPLAKENQPGLILLDVMLPEMSGFDIIKLLQADDACKNIPIIFLTARSMPSEIQMMKDLGALGYLAKPFDPMTLVSQINTVLAPTGKAIGA
jgi:two-component system, OmpR family, response regulator